MGTGVVVGATLLVVSMLTRYPLGVVKVLPFQVHRGRDRRPRRQAARERHERHHAFMYLVYLAKSIDHALEIVSGVLQLARR